MPRDFSYVVRVYLHPPNVPFQPEVAEFRTRYLAGRFTVWGDDIPGHGETARTKDVNLDVSRAYEALTRQPGGVDDIKVSFDFERIDKDKVARVAWGTPGIEFRSARLVVNPAMFHGKK